MKSNVQSKPIPTIQYRRMVRLLPILTVDVVVLTTDGTKTLVGLRNNRPAKGTWYTLGGRLHKGETILSRATQVLAEEAGLHISKRDLRFLGVLDERFSDSNLGRFPTHNVNVYFGVRVKPSRMTPDPQHSQLAWLPVRSRRIHPYARHKIQQALHDL